MSTLHHYLATETRTLCGQVITDQTLGTGDGEQFAQVVANPALAFCPKCVALMRRHVLHRSALRTSIVARLQAMGIDVSHA